jgi:MFS transporter, SP family, general alpha glucoside:H+ symporter
MREALEMRTPMPRSPPAPSRRRSRPSQGTLDSVDDMLDESKPHPSEYLEFHSVPPNLSPHVEYAGLQEKDDGSLYEDSPPVSPTSYTSSQHPFVMSSHRINRELMNTVPDFKNLAREARLATTSEHRMTFVQAIRTYPKAIGWSILLSLTIVMEGFDITLVTSFFAFPQFQRSFGHPTGNGDFQISTTWQTALTVGAVVGEIIGLLLNGPLIDQFGNRKVMITSLVALSLFIFLAFFSSDNISILLASQVLSGIPWGVFQTLTTTYAAEVMPVALRAFLTSNVNLCWVVGQLISAAMLRALINWDSELAFRVPFALQWMWTIPILVGVLFAPESPWWLVRHEKTDAARRSLLRLTRTGEGFKVEETISMMKHTNEVEKYLRAGTGYRDCFRGTDRRRTEIVCMVWITQAVSATVAGNAAYFYEQAGLSSDRAFDLTTGMYVAGIFGAILSWFLMRVCGRRTLYLWGSAVCGLSLLVAGIVGAAAADSAPVNSAASWTLGALIVLTTLVYDSTIGPVCYSLVAEIPSTRMRVKTVVLARIVYNTVILIGNILMPRMLNPTAWNWKGKTCFLWAFLTLGCFVWTYYRLPEPKGLTYMELDILFEKGAPARKFKKFQGKLAETGYFSLATKEEGEGERNEWHLNRRVGKTPLEGRINAPL